MVSINVKFHIPPLLLEIFLPMQTRSKDINIDMYIYTNYTML